MRNMKIKFLSIFLFRPNPKAEIINLLSIYSYQQLVLGQNDGEITSDQLDNPL